MKKLLFFLLSTMLIISCKKSNNSVDQPLPAQTFSNVAYGTDAAHRMDIFLPEARTTSTTKIMVLIHGGGWNAGDKTDFTGFISILQQRLPEYAIFNINYRLATGSNFFPVQENDVKLAVDFIVSKAEEYKINKDRMVLLGVSAGAHLALLQAYKNSSPKIKAIIDFFGPTDLVEMYNKPLNALVPASLQTVTGTTPSANPSLYQHSSPINYVSASSPSTLILHGGKDNVVAISQSILLRDKLQTFSVVNEMITYPDEGHGWIGTSLSNSFDRIETFLRANVQ